MDEKELSWDEIIERQKATEKARVEREEQAQQEAAAKRERDRLAREAQEKARKEAQEKAQEKARAEKEAYRQKMINMVEAVDLDGIMAELNHILSEPDHRFYQAMDWIQYGLQIAASKAPQRLYAFLGARKAAFEGFLLIRSQIMTVNAIRKHDSTAGPPYYGQLPKEVVEVWLPRLETIGKSIQETVTTFSRADHALKLASGKKTGSQTRIPHERDQQSEQPGNPSGNPSRRGSKATESESTQPNPTGASVDSSGIQGNTDPTGRGVAAS